MTALRLQELCRDSDRVASLVAVHNSSFGKDHLIMVDLSRQHMTSETLQHLLRLSLARQVPHLVHQLAWGPWKQVLQQDHQRLKQQQRMQHAGIARFQHNNNNNNNNNNADNEDDEPEHRQPVGLPSMHLALRIPRDVSDACIYNAQGDNVLIDIHSSWRRLERLSDSIRNGQYRGATGSMLRDIVVIARGVAMECLGFLQHAFMQDERAVTASQAGLAEAATARMLRRNFSHQSAPTRRLILLRSTDPTAAAQAVADLDPGTTLVLSIAQKGNEEMGIATKTLKSWLLHHLAHTRKPDVVLAKHMMLVTANDLIASVINKPESVHLIPEIGRCEAFSSFTAATLLPLSLVYGWPLVQEFIQGAHDMDQHFVQTNPRHNLPVLLALADVWNDVHLNMSARVITPFSDAFDGYAAFVAALEAHACASDDGQSASLIIKGDTSHDRTMYQGSVINSELVLAMNTQVPFNTTRTIGAHGLDELYATQDAVVCSFFAHADELALGSEKSGGVSSNATVDPWSSPSVASLNTMNDASSSFHYTSAAAASPLSSTGNRPSILLICNKLDAFTCGQLVALTEHRALVKAHIWGLDPFARELGTSVRINRTELLRDELQDLFHAKGKSAQSDAESSDNLNLSTKSILEHYASMIRSERESSAKQQYFL
jgi:glucose-6-phosphate isomerase